MSSSFSDPTGLRQRFSSRPFFRALPQEGTIIDVISLMDYPLVVTGLDSCEETDSSTKS